MKIGLEEVMLDDNFVAYILNDSSDFHWHEKHHLAGMQIRYSSCQKMSRQLDVKLLEISSYF